MGLGSNRHGGMVDVKRIYMALGSILFLALASLALGSQDILAYQTEDDCNGGGPVRWSGNSATFNTTNGNFPLSWRNQITLASEIWESSVVDANFEFTHGSSSNNDWKKRTNYYTT